MYVESTCEEMVVLVLVLVVEAAVDVSSRECLCMGQVWWGGWVGGLFYLLAHLIIFEVDILKEEEQVFSVHFAS
ncbi:hypothetical protein E2C01_021296 [Portunus trituberculatus]|uniref:Uncharacterized protein n=1 Tax=Portunus trituberculatus TaxID=210409 RepID=A0A5B7E287_PORTR|nr:hypothetical protein [Portunus trituberculatus]